MFPQNTKNVVAGHMWPASPYSPKPALGHNIVSTLWILTISLTHFANWSKQKNLFDAWISSEYLALRWSR